VYAISPNDESQFLLGDNMPDADNMELTDQVSAYDQCGLKIKSDLLGNLDLLRQNRFH
jgi:hypothetical protein